jgi:hypothetical protein
MYVTKKYAITSLGRSKCGILIIYEGSINARTKQVIILKVFNRFEHKFYRISDNIYKT